MSRFLLDKNQTMQVPFGSKITYFSSEFYDFNNDNEDSKIEEFDVSQQYLKSDFTEKSIILKELNQSNFLKILQVYNKVCLYQSLCKFFSNEDSWKKINEKQKVMESKNSKNVTKVFLKLFYLLSKKIRAKVEKSFLKIHNFTKNNEMKTYEILIAKGINKLDQTFKTLDIKYFYDHQINSHQMVSWAFKQVNSYVKILKNRKRIEDMVTFVNKMTKHVLLKQFYKMMKKWEKTLQKIDIFVGSLNLFVNPIRRDIFQKLKKNVFSKNPGTIFSAENNKKLKFKRVRGYNISSNQNNRVIESFQQKRSENQDYYNFTNNDGHLSPTCQQKSKQNIINSKIRLKCKNDEKVSEYQTISFQNSVSKFKKPKDFNRVESEKPLTLIFNSKRPMKKIKSTSKDSITKLKSLKKFSQKPQKSLRSEQIHSEYYDSKKESFHKICNPNNRTNLTTLSLKSLKSFSIEKSILKSLRTKSLKKQN